MSHMHHVSRRNFLQSAGTLSGIACLRLTGAALATVAQAACTAEQKSAAFLVLGNDEAADFAAIAARIIPTTDTPGATEAGVIHFFDNAFADVMRDQLPEARRGLAEFNARLGEFDAAASRFGELSEAEQDAFLITEEEGDFFNLVWTMTIFGFFAMSKYGGNKDHIAWELIGFGGHNGGWSYPFGYYDAEYAKEPANGK